MRYLAILILALTSTAHAQLCETRKDNYHQSIEGTTYYNHLWCENAQGLYGRTLFGTVQDAAACLPKLQGVSFTPGTLNAVTVDKIWTACRNPNRVPSVAEWTVINALNRKWLPRLSVTAGQERPIYFAKPDGTRGAQWLEGGKPMVIPAGKPCKAGPRLKGTSTRFYRVEWQLGHAAGSSSWFTIPTGAYAVCTISYAPVAGWP